MEILSFRVIYLTEALSMLEGSEFLSIFLEGSSGSEKSNLVNISFFFPDSLLRWGQNNSKMKQKNLEAGNGNSRHPRAENINQHILTVQITFKRGLSEKVTLITNTVATVGWECFFLMYPYPYPVLFFVS